MGRQPGTSRLEAKRIAAVINALIAFSFDVKLKSEKDVHRFLVERSIKAQQSLGSPWPADIVVRPARRASYVSKATSKKFLQRCVDAMASIDAGLVRDAAGEKWDLVSLLIYSPRLRFDRKSLLLR